MKPILNQLLSKSMNQIKLLLQNTDLKFQSLIPNLKLRKIVYYVVGGLFGFMFLIVIIGVVLSIYKNSHTSSGSIPTKVGIENEMIISQKELSEEQKEIINLRNTINNLTFPESILTVPTIESKLTL